MVNTTFSPQSFFLFFFSQVIRTSWLLWYHVMMWGWDPDARKRDKVFISLSTKKLLYCMRNICRTSWLCCTVSFNTLALRFRKLYVCVSMVLCLLLSCLILFFLFPRSVTLTPVSVLSVVVFFTPDQVEMRVTVSDVVSEWLYLKYEDGFGINRHLFKLIIIPAV